jgi:hypothetical protein
LRGAGDIINAGRQGRRDEIALRIRRRGRADTGLPVDEFNGGIGNGSIRRIADPSGDQRILRNESRRREAKRDQYISHKQTRSYVREL